MLFLVLYGGWFWNIVFVFFVVGLEIVFEGIFFRGVLRYFELSFGVVGINVSFFVVIFWKVVDSFSCISFGVFVIN